MGKDIIKEMVKKKGRDLLRKSEGSVGSAYIELELFYDDSWLPEPYILVASTRDSNVSPKVSAEQYETEEEAEADYISLKNKYNLKVSTQK